MTTNLTISQGLRLVKKLKGELAEQVERAAASVTWKVGDDPAYDFAECVLNAHQIRERLIQLESQIARTNAQTSFVFGGDMVTGGIHGEVSLTLAVLRLKELKGLIKWYTDLKSVVKNGAHVEVSEKDYNDTTHRYETTKVGYQCKLPEVDRAAAVAAYRNVFDALNTIVEDLNHRTTLRVTNERTA